LTLAFLLTLARQYSSPIHEHKSLVYHCPKVLEVSSFQSIFKIKTGWLEGIGLKEDLGNLCLPQIQTNSNRI
jgi:hypothetical protein